MDVKQIFSLASGEGLEIKPSLLMKTASCLVAKLCVQHLFNGYLSSVYYRSGITLDANLHFMYKNKKSIGRAIQLEI